MILLKEYRVIKIFSKELKKEKRIYLYLPKSYDTSNKFYPVLYMHDGGNLFDDKISYSGVSWGILDAYENNPDLPELIIVGIESDIDRGKELIPYEFVYKNGKKDGGNAHLYLNFITKELKPIIERKYRALKSPENTGIMGSSFGGVNCIYASIAYNNYFTRFGCVSNALYYGGFEEELKKNAEQATFDSVKKFYMDVGTKETDDIEENNLYIQSNKEMAKIISNKINSDIFKLNIVEEGKHHEIDWAKRFPEIIAFLFNN